MAVTQPVATNTNGVDFVANFLQGFDQWNQVLIVPTVVPLEAQAALQLSGRNPGGLAYRGNSAAAAPNTTNAAILLDGMETMVSRLGYTKNGAFLVHCNGTNAVAVPLTNTATNTNAQAGDTVFTTWKQITLYNLSGLDGNNSAVMYVSGSGGTNGANLNLNANGVHAIAGSSRITLENINGATVNAANAVVTITPTADGTFGMVISG